MIEGFSLSNYLLLLEYTGRLFREGIDLPGVWPASADA